MTEHKIQNTENRKCLVRLGLLSTPIVLCLGLFVSSSQAGERHLNDRILAIWNSPEFQKRLAESYIAETEIEPTVTESERDAVLKAFELMKSDKMDEAAKVLQKNIKGQASSAVLDFTLANIYLQQEKFEQAAANYQQAVDKYPKFRRAWKNLGLIRMRRAEFGKAIEALTRVLELGGSDALTFAQLGYAYLLTENNLCAESAYRMAVLLDPDTLDWKVGLASSVLKQQRYAEAVALFDQLIADDPDSADLWLYQANAYIGLNQPVQAAVNYEMIDKMGGSTAKSLNKLGDIYVNQELFETAVDSYIRALEKDPQAGTEHVLRVARLLVFRGALADTKRLIASVEKLNGDNLSEQKRKDLLRLRAQIAVAEGSGEEQIKVLEEVVKIDPLDGQALILLGQHYGRTGEFEKAVFYFERAENIEKFEADAKVRHAQLLVRQGKYGEALPLLRSAQNLKPREEVQKYLEQVERFAKSRS
jgi:tetratricopeptide (TPR) repeat protein